MGQLSDHEHIVGSSLGGSLLFQFSRSMLDELPTVLALRKQIAICLTVDFKHISLIGSDQVLMAHEIVLDVGALVARQVVSPQGRAGASTIRSPAESEVT